jgi:prepilin-type N-terminal cleavage/methylation domain-containing protein
MVASLPKNERGLTLIELMVSMVIIFIVFMGLTDAGIIVLDQNVRNALREEAILVADNVVAHARNTPKAALDSSPTLNFVVRREFRGRAIDYNVTRAVNPLSDGNNTEVTVTVNWQRQAYMGKWQTRSYSHQVTTMVSSGTIAR